MLTQRDTDGAVIRLAAEMGGSVNAAIALRILDRLHEYEEAERLGYNNVADYLKGRMPQS